MPDFPSPPPPELLYLLTGDEEDLLAACQDLRPADVAEALNQLPVEAAARVVAALPFHLAVQLLDEPELDRRGDIFELLDEKRAIPLVEAISPDQQVELFRALKKGDRTGRSMSSTPLPAMPSACSWRTRRPARAES